ncbi:Wings apart-like protein-like protein [Heterocephalus glaber]|uniref:Wings apart-like protein-like protein n=1 Tax=Heterocephalus glaber TaxID=10181 RepID=G5BZ34_HETGA|nr:Wings apart-like protein-like protein [Heterocephalus glaber]
MDEFTASTPADLGEAGGLRKKANIATAKTTTRFRPTNVKSKKDVKLEFFGFEDHDETRGDERGSGSSNYKIKCFGFDDLSESEDDDNDDCQVEGKANKKRTKTAPSHSLQPPPESNDNSQDSQCSASNTENLDFAEDLPDSEELPGPPVVKPQNVTVRLSSKEPNQKDDGIFKAPTPPLKVIKTVTLPTQPYQDIVIALKCRKEDKELYTIVQHVKHFDNVVEFDCEELIQQYNHAENSICVADSKPLPPQNVTCHMGKEVEDCIWAITGVLLNLTNDNEWGSTKTGEQNGLIGIAMNRVLGEIQWVSTEKTDSAEEKHKKEEDDEELDLNKALQHAGKHMEDCVMAPYTALLLGCLCQESPINVTPVREYLPEGDFSIMTEMLKIFLSFMNLTCAVGMTGQKSISRVT